MADQVLGSRPIHQGSDLNFTSLQIIPKPHSRRIFPFPNSLSSHIWLENQKHICSLKTLCRRALHNNLEIKTYIPSNCERLPTLCLQSRKADRYYFRSITRAVETRGLTLHVWYFSGFQFRVSHRLPRRGFLLHRVIRFKCFVCFAIE